MGNIEGNLYGALCKLRDYEKSGFEPDDLTVFLKTFMLVQPFRTMPCLASGTTAV